VEGVGSFRVFVGDLRVALSLTLLTCDKLLRRYLKNRTYTYVEQVFLHNNPERRDFGPFPKLPASLDAIWLGQMGNLINPRSITAVVGAPTALVSFEPLLLDSVTFALLRVEFVGAGGRTGMTGWGGVCSGRTSAV
jgi:hypothetical protein